MSIRHCRAQRVALLAVCLAGCVAPASTGTPSPATVSGVRVVIENQGPEELTIFVLQNDSRYRLGYVRPMRRATLRIRSVPPAPIRLYADPSGPGRAFETEPMSLLPGDQILLRVGLNPLYSSWMVLPPPRY